SMSRSRVRRLTGKPWSSRWARSWARLAGRRRRSRMSRYRLSLPWKLMAWRAGQNSPRSGRKKEDLPGRAGEVYTAERRRRLVLGDHAHDAAVVAGLAEGHHAIAEREQGVVGPDAHVLAGVVLGAALANDDVAGDGLLPAEELHTQSFRVRFATVVGTTCAFLVCHGLWDVLWPGLSP